MDENTRKDEEAFFEVWWALYRQRQWEKNNLDRGPHPNEHFMQGLKGLHFDGWMARASLHVSGRHSHSAGVGENG